LKIASELIREKVIRQERLIRKQLRNDDAADVIVRARQALTQARSSDEIKRYEANAALAYWTAWHDLPVTFSRADLRRIPEHWMTFGSRMSPLTSSPRLAVSPPNAILNYLYAVLESEARLALSELGLDPGIGMLHSDTRTRDSLACDLMEPVRPHVDAFLLDWLQRAPLQRKWFFEERDGNCRLTSEFVAELSETLKMWRRALAPVAEWIARTLWSTTSRSSQMKAPATRLTQDQRRKAKGIPTSTSGILSPLTAFSNCVPLVCRNNALLPPKPVRLTAHDPIAQARRADTQRRQNAAIKAWDATKNPEWLDQSFFEEQILPRLRAVAASRIISAVEVSEPYALAIRAGRRRPHPRHWLRLASLTGCVRDRLK
jgi:hypothetical protein